MKLTIKDIEKLADPVKAFLAFIINDDAKLSMELLDSELMKDSSLDKKCNKVLEKVDLTTDFLQGVGDQMLFERLLKAYYPNIKVKNFSNRIHKLFSST